jgi:hypothetical protein
MANFRHDRINELKLKTRDRLAIELADTEILLSRSNEELETLQEAIKELQGTNGLHLINERVARIKSR